MTSSPGSVRGNPAGSAPGRARTRQGAQGVRERARRRGQQVWGVRVLPRLWIFLCSDTCSGEAKNNLIFERGGKKECLALLLLPAVRASVVAAVATSPSRAPRCSAVKPGLALPAPRWPPGL